MEEAYYYNNAYSDFVMMRILSHESKRSRSFFFRSNQKGKRRILCVRCGVWAYMRKTCCGN